MDMVSIRGIGFPQLTSRGTCARAEGASYSILLPCTRICTSMYCAMTTWPTRRASSCSHRQASSLFHFSRPFDGASRVMTGLRHESYRSGASSWNLPSTPGHHRKHPYHEPCIACAIPRSLSGRHTVCFAVAPGVLPWPLRTAHTLARFAVTLSMYDLKTNDITVSCKRLELLMFALDA
jgi:hypothetical protein